MFSAFNLAFQICQLSNYGVHTEGPSHTTGTRFITQLRMWNVKLENNRNRNIRDKALEEMVKQLNIPDLTQEDVKLKIKSIRSRYSSELARQAFNWRESFLWRPAKEHEHTELSRC